MLRQFSNQGEIAKMVEQVLGYLEGPQIESRLRHAALYFEARMGTLKKDSNCGASMPTAEAPQYTREKKSLSCTAARLLWLAAIYVTDKKASGEPW